MPPGSLENKTDTPVGYSDIDDFRIHPCIWHSVALLSLLGLLIGLWLDL